jgi:hypothetical protein
MMGIEAYDFGTITIDGKTFNNDLKIVRGKVVPDWWRLEGHRLVGADIEDILAARPQVLVVGTGDPGMMKVSGEVRTRLGELGIELIERPTRQACDEFNTLLADRGDPTGVAFAAHLTC